MATWYDTAWIGGTASRWIFIQICDINVLIEFTVLAALRYTGAITRMMFWPRDLDLIHVLHVTRSSFTSVFFAFLRFILLKIRTDRQTERQTGRQTDGLPCVTRPHGRRGRVILDWNTVYMQEESPPLDVTFIGDRRRLCQLIYCISCARCTQDAQLSQRDRAAGCVIVFAKSRTLELGDNILWTL